ncbi:MAG: zf-TFIIB domain-containing protein [Myxococcales bacterium]|nr:zf-TFIIB domain-containing protein [Myxococcales bacterium]
MTDVYRTSGFLCPSCTNTPLREFGTRLVCDECNGMLIDAEDIATSIHELDGESQPLVTDDDQPTTQACPRCTQAMISSELSLGKLRLKGRFMRCTRDGIWFPRDAMTAAFARASRSRPGGGRGSGAPSGGSGGSGMTGVMNTISGAFGSGPASGRLAISHWESNRPRVHTLFVSAYKDRTLGCPSCKEAKLQFQGDRWACATCAGAFVENAALTAMVEEMTAAPWEIPAVTGAGSDRHCPVCAELMAVEVLEAVTIDRCAPHGVWFDDTELQTALHHASSPDRGVGSWIKQLFHRHGKHES